MELQKRRKNKINGIILDKKEYAKKYFKKMQDKGIMCIPPYTYSYIMANDSIIAVKQKNLTGFLMPPYKHFILPPYSDEFGFENRGCLYSFPNILDKTKVKKLVTTQLILHRDYSLLNYRKLGDDLRGNGRPILYNQKELNWFLDRKLVRFYNECLFLKNTGQHLFLYEVDDVKLLIVWDDYYSSCINIIGLSQVVRVHKERCTFNHPYTILQVYISAFCAFFRMFPSGTLFNVTLEEIIGTPFAIIYVPLYPIACFEIYAKVRGEIEEAIRIYDKFDKVKWLKYDKNLFTKSIYHPKFKRKKKATYSNKKSKAERRAMKNLKKKEKKKLKPPKPRKRKVKKVKKKKKLDSMYTRKRYRHIRKGRTKKNVELFS